MKKKTKKEKRKKEAEAHTKKIFFTPCSVGARSAFLIVDVERLAPHADLCSWLVTRFALFFENVSSM